MAVPENKLYPLNYMDVRPDLYEIDAFGNIWSHYKKGFLHPTKDKDGYYKIGLRTCYSSPRTVRIATLVAWTFIGAPLGLEDPTVNHIDGNALNNHYSNLEWIERRENSSIRNHRDQGSSNSQAKLNENQVREICQLLQNTNLSTKQIGEKYPISSSTIVSILHKRTWKSITTNYDFSGRKSIRDSNTGQFIIINANSTEG